ncbi:MAG TPA: acetyl-CoA carboxylase biotin carboxylase subunit [Terriglobia bacterium]|nr:acetyl-CoA carboxylase biotin carboxylase subunit [Terriglobia bacterium]
MFKKILISNRGEIAVRVIRACREMRIATAAVYSEADRGALHARMADEAFPIGPAPAIQSYLLIERIMDAAARAGADAIHPGYGFLAENAALAEACEAGGVTFIGPSPASMRLMGLKVESRRAVARSGAPIVPGSTDPITDDRAAKSLADSIGYPIMLKASAGGGGKGMRLVAAAKELESALSATRAEAAAAFGDDAIYIEKFIEQPRHIEIQVLADRHGAAITLGERECTIQRRHQKVIEECPSPIVDADLRRRMSEAALQVARAASYTNAGTVEFLVDRNRQFYFLEMNTRLQVEHPITEMVTGVDIVQQQIRIAAGEPLSLKQDDVSLRGAAIECRVYAEDPDNNFFPSPGRITQLRRPSGPWVRDDSGVYEGWTVPVDYDPLISKLAVWGATRHDALDRMRRALGEYRVEGIRTNLDFFREVLEHPHFRQGDFDTGFIDRWLAGRPEPAEPARDERDLAAIVAAIAEAARKPAPAGSAGASQPESAWKRIGRLRALKS